MASSLATQISQHIYSTKFILPSQSFINTFLQSQKQSVPFQSLCQTALFRLLASEISLSVQPTPENTFPANVHDVESTSIHLKGPIPVQVADVEDIGTSKMSQLEAIESAERGEKMKGKEVIRVVPGEEGLNAEELGLTESKGPHKLLLEDAKGVRVYGLEVRPIEGVSIAINIGSKMVLRDVKVMRGVLILDSGNTSVIGGKVEEMHKKWRETRKDRLRAALVAQKENVGNGEEDEDYNED